VQGATSIVSPESAASTAVTMSAYSAAPVQSTVSVRAFEATARGADSRGASMDAQESRARSGNSVSTGTGAG
jgi:hypothetical protein